MSHTIVIFGASGDLTSRKLVPALYELSRKGRLPEQTRVLGYSRTRFSDEAWREKLAESTAEYLESRFERPLWDAFARSIFYQPGDISQPDDFQRAQATLGRTRRTRGRDARLLSRHRPPVLRVGHRPTRRRRPGTTNRGPRARRHRKTVRHRSGHRPAAQRRASTSVFDEHQVYRIDHYLGKETVQNMLVLRFANTIFEPIWNRNYIDHVQITVAEEVTVGHRARLLRRGRACSATCSRTTCCNC